MASVIISGVRCAVVPARYPCGQPDLQIMDWLRLYLNARVCYPSIVGIPLVRPTDPAAKVLVTGCYPCGELLFDDRKVGGCVTAIIPSAVLGGRRHAPCF